MLLANMYVFPLPEYLSQLKILFRWVVLTLNTLGPEVTVFFFTPRPAIGHKLQANHLYVRKIFPKIHPNRTNLSEDTMKNTNYMKNRRVESHFVP